jgi:hypothetical protein
MPGSQSATRGTLYSYGSPTRVNEAWCGAKNRCKSTAPPSEADQACGRDPQ